jgi:hypothetical protein
VDLLTLGKEYCDKDAFLTTDGHSGYNFFTGFFLQHDVVDHSSEFMRADGRNTNLAEGFFSRMRSAETGAWHKMTLSHLEEYGWEFAWRQTMVGSSNLDQLKDLLVRVLCNGRAQRYRDYWGKSKTAGDSPTRGEPDQQVIAHEIRKDTVPKKVGRPVQPKRRYTRRTSLTKGAGLLPDGDDAASDVDST